MSAVRSRPQAPLKNHPTAGGFFNAIFRVHELLYPFINEADDETIFCDAIIIGAGASGVFCAWNTVLRGKKIAVLEHNSKALRKVAISGGGKCNLQTSVLRHKTMFLKIHSLQSRLCAVFRHMTS